MAKIRLRIDQGSRMPRQQEFDTADRKIMTVDYMNVARNPGRALRRGLAMPRVPVQECQRVVKPSRYRRDRGRNQGGYGKVRTIL
jgi:hypothetical protein